MSALLDSQRKRVLWGAVVGVTVVGLAAVAVMLASSLKPNARARADAPAVRVDLRSLHEGVPLKLTLRAVPIFMLKPSASQSQSISTLSTHVWHPELENFIPELGVFVYVGLSTHLGCALRDMPAGPSGLTQFEPGRNASWLGGYTDPNCDASYDYAGRTIKTWTYTYNGFNAELPNLAGVTVSRASDHEIDVEFPIHFAQRGSRLRNSDR